MIEKILSRIDEISELIRPVGWSRKIEVVETKAVREIVQEVAKEYGNVSDIDLEVVSALPSLYPLIQPFEEEAIHRVVAKAKGGRWIPVESGQLPKHLETVWVTVKTEDDYCYVTDSFYDLNFGKWRVGKLREVIAWQPKYIPPTPYQKGE